MPGKVITPLADETREVLTNAETAWHLNMREQTLRKWACTDKGPIRPIRVGGRLRWKTSDVRKLVGAV